MVLLRLTDHDEILVDLTGIKADSNSVDQSGNHCIETAGDAGSVDDRREEEQAMTDYLSGVLLTSMGPPRSYNPLACPSGRLNAMVGQISESTSPYSELRCITGHPIPL